MNLSQAFQIKNGDHIAFIGGGGKSSTMFRLGTELAQAGKKILLTTSTRIFSEQIQNAPAVIFFNPDRESVGDILPALKTAVAKHGQVLLVGATDAQDEKAHGVDPAAIDEIARANIFDAILNEADGSRMRPFKAPADHEPVIGHTTTLVVPVVGLDTLGMPLHADYIHRPEKIAALTNIAPNAPITAQNIADVLTHPNGGLKNVPSTARVIPLLNKLDAADEASARKLARLILQNPRIHSVAIGATAAETPIAWVENRVATIILAAGEGRRFGAPKQLAQWRGKSLLAHTIDTALTSPADAVFVVLGAHADSIRPKLARENITIVQNDNWAAGQSTSMQAGLSALPANIAAVIFLLADQPMLVPQTIAALIDRYRRTLAPLVIPQFEGRTGNPILIDRQLFSELMAIRGDTGARPVVKAHRANAEIIIVPSAAILRDVDTPQDLDELG